MPEVKSEQEGTVASGGLVPTEERVEAMDKKDVEDAEEQALWAEWMAEASQMKGCGCLTVNHVRPLSWEQPCTQPCFTVHSALLHCARSPSTIMPPAIMPAITWQLRHTLRGPLCQQI